MKYSTSPTPSTSASFAGSGGYASRSTSPLPPPAQYSTNCLSASSKSYRFLRRLFKFDQMDFEFAAWQMWYLFVSPRNVYRNFNYRKHTKLQFARDDPAFLVLLVISLCVTSLAFAWVLGLSFLQTLWFVFYVIFVDCIFAGILVATFFWFVANRYLRSNQIDPDVEWGYAFDVHLNAFFPPLVILHFIQLFFYHWLVEQSAWFLSRFFGNSLWLLAIGYYIYITFLGYNCVTHLKNTRFILVAIPIAFLFYVVTLIISWNLTATFVSFYKYRIY